MKAKLSASQLEHSGKLGALEVMKIVCIRKIFVQFVIFICHAKSAAHQKEIRASSIKLSECFGKRCSGNEKSVSMRKLSPCEINIRGNEIAAHAFTLNVSDEN